MKTSWYSRNKARSLANAIAWQKANPEKKAAHQRAIRARKWAKVYEVYGSSCRCCGETEPLFLTVDHINNDGAAHRRQMGHKNMLLWLARNNYPPGFQTLCMNCNLGKARNKGTCPHEVKNVAELQ